MKASPNPNVVFELGYAVARLGWERVVLLFNTQYGEFPGDLPFDFDRHRAMPFKAVASTDANGQNSAVKSRNAGAAGQLTAGLQRAIELVVEHDPARPTSQMSDDEIKRARDVTNITWILETVHHPTLDSFYLDAPKYLTHKLLDMWTSFSAVLNDSLFHLYDKELGERLREFHDAFNCAVIREEMYDSPGSGTGERLIFQSNACPFEESQKIYGELTAARDRMYKAMTAILERIRDRYIEVDLDAASRTAGARLAAAAREREAMHGRFDEAG
ncbi:hypothetical protein [Paraburkholderia tropica]|uniref:hypothetical protein n=1 Tax=Paraburkholderia tropica TaxID=92647 RepID=UPI002AB68A7D|nr:hypothetical protein [Paraburkholderia tropica]